MRKAAHFMALPACLAVAGCNTWTNWFPPAAPTTATEVPYRDTAMVIPMRDCPVTGAGRRPGVVISPSALPALAAAAIPLVIDVGVKTLVDEVKRAQDNLTATYVAYGTVPLDNGKPLGEGGPAPGNRSGRSANFRAL